MSCFYFWRDIILLHIHIVYGVWMCSFSVLHFFTKLVFKNIFLKIHPELKYAAAVFKLPAVLSPECLCLFWGSPVLKFFTFLVASFYFFPYTRWYQEGLRAIYILEWGHLVNYFCLCLWVFGFAILVTLSKFKWCSLELNLKRSSSCRLRWRQEGRRRINYIKFFCFNEVFAFLDINYIWHKPICWDCFSGFMETVIIWNSINCDGLFQENQSVGPIKSCF